MSNRVIGPYSYRAPVTVSAVDKFGVPLSGVTVTFKDATTTATVAAFSDEDLTTAYGTQSTDGNGRLQCYLPAGTYTVTFSDSRAVASPDIQILGVEGNLHGAVTTTAPSAGGAGALPATPKGYLTVLVNGVSQQIAYY